MHPLTRWLCDRIPPASAFEETAIVAPSVAAARTLREAVILGGRDLAGAHFVTVPELARLISERSGVAAPARRPDPLEELALLRRALAAGDGPLHRYARRFPGAQRHLVTTIRAWESSGCGRATDSAAGREFVAIGERLLASSRDFATRGRLTELALTALDGDRVGLRRVLFVAVEPTGDVRALRERLAAHDVAVEAWTAVESAERPTVTRRSTPDLECELRAAARACLASAESGSPWRELVVAVPRLATYADHLRRAFAAEGVPLCTAAESSLAREPRAALCAHIARLLFDNTPRRSYLAIAGSPLLRQPPRPLELHAFDALSRRDHFRGRGPHVSQFIAALRHRLREHGRSSLPQSLERWTGCAEDLGDDATLDAKISALESFMFEFVRTPEPGSRDAICAERIAGVLEAWRRSAAIDPPKLDGRGLADAIEDTLRGRGMPVAPDTDPHGGADGVRVIAYDEMLATPATELHLCGLAAGMVPTASPSEVILGPRERVELGMPDAAADRAAQRARLRAAVRHPTRGLHLSRPRRSDDGRAVGPAPWLGDLLGDLLNGLEPAADEHIEPSHPLSRADAAIRDGRCPRDLAMIRLALGDGDEQSFHHIAGTSGAATWARARDLERFEATKLDRDGDLGPALGSALVDRRLSVTSLRTLGYCPQQFMFDEVLGLRQTKLPDEPDPCELPRDRLGTVIHRVLETLYAEFRAPLAGADRCVDLCEPMLTRSEELLERELRSERGPLRREFPTLHVLLERRWREALRGAVRWDLETMDDDGSRPQAVEQTLESTLTVPTRAGGTRALPLLGRVDRVDRLRDGALRVIDFKTGAHPERDVDTEELLRARRPQLPAYALMLQQRGPDAPRVGEVCVRAVRPAPLDQPFCHTLESAEQWLGGDGRLGAGFAESLGVLADLKARGAFVPTPDTAPCGFCAYRSACRRLHPPSADRVRNCGIEEADRYTQLGRKNTKSPLLSDE